MKRKGSILVYVLIIMAALIIVFTSVSGYIITTSKLNKNYSNNIDYNLNLDSSLSIAREFIISEINNKKYSIKNESYINDIIYNIQDNSYITAINSYNNIIALNCDVEITRSGSWPKYTYHIKVFNMVQEKTQDIHLNIELKTVTEDDITTSPYPKPIQNNNSVEISINEWQRDKDYSKGDRVVYNGLVYVAVVDKVEAYGFNPASGSEVKWRLDPFEIIDWVSDLAYKKGDRVVHNGLLYEAIQDIGWNDFEPGTGSSQKWKLISDEPVEWVYNLAYKTHDRVLYNGDLYEAKQDISWYDSPPGTGANQKWKLITDEPINWVNNVRYETGDRVVCKGILYEAKQDIDWYDFEPGTGANQKWKLISDTPLNWVNNLSYNQGEEVIHNGILYIAMQNIGAYSSEPNSGNNQLWKSLAEEPLNWVGNLYYKKNDSVIYDGKLYIAKENIGAYENNPNNNSKWIVQNSDVEIWNNKEYDIGEIVIYNGYKYKARVKTASKPDNGYDWEIISVSVPFWIDTKGYNVGETVFYNGILYTALKNIQGANPSQDVNWKVTSGNPNEWIQRVYKVGEIVKYGSFQYKAVNNTSAEPALNNDWILIGDKPYYYIDGKVYNNGDKVTYNGDIYEYISSENRVILPGPQNLEWKIILEEDKISNWRNINYKVGEKVMYNGIIYEAKKDIQYTSDMNNAIRPNKGDYWNIISSNVLYWINGKTYFINQKVVYNNLVYIAKKDTSSNPSKGYDWIIEGDYPQYWLPEKGYQANECVVYNGHIYEAVITNDKRRPDISPSYWRLK